MLNVIFKLYSNTLTSVMYVYMNSFLCFDAKDANFNCVKAF